jgi:O-antigen ligase
MYINKALPGVDMSNQVHNSQLQIAIESGLPGGVIFLAIMGAVFSGVLRNVKRGGEVESIQLLRIGGICAGVAVMVHISFGTEFNSTSIFLVFWILLGLARSRPNLEAKKELGSYQASTALNALVRDR